MMTFNEQLETIASKCAAKEIYNQYLYMLIQHMEVIDIVSGNCRDIRTLKFLAETYAVASIASNGDAKDQIMYDTLREIAYQTAISKDHIIQNSDAISFVLMNSLSLIKLLKKSMKRSMRKP